MPFISNFTRLLAITAFLLGSAAVMGNPFVHAFSHAAIAADAPAAATPTPYPVAIGQEVAVPHHLQDGDEYTLALPDLLAHGELLFSARWTAQEGAGRPLAKGTGVMLADPSTPLRFPRNFNRVSGPDANACASCHNLPYGVPGGSGDFVTNVFVLGQRFDFATFSADDATPTHEGLDERGELATAETIGNLRASVGMFGSGYIEMLARQMTAELQQLRDGLTPGAAIPLTAKGVHFGTLSRDYAGRWDTSQVQGLPLRSLDSSGPLNPPSLLIRPFHQSGTVISLREFTNSAFNHHHGIQSTERFGIYRDPDGDGFVDELTRADMTAVVLYQATLAAPGRVIPNNPAVETAILAGEERFDQIGCNRCHVNSLPLTDNGWLFTEPNPYNPALNLQPGDAPTLTVDLADPALPGPRLPLVDGVVQVPAYTDLKLHNITSGPDDPNMEPLDLNRSGEPGGIFEGNPYFLTARLWGAANQPPYFHHGKFTTMREAILAHAGEALTERQAFAALSQDEQNALIEFLKSLQILPPGTTALVVDELGRPKSWPPKAEQ
ncbi:MAG: di-heme oxidoredictase family protein [Caldilineaceae bacterium]